MPRTEDTETMRSLDDITVVVPDLENDSYNSSGVQRSHSLWDYQLNSRIPMKLSLKQIASVTLHWRCLTLSVLLGVCFSLLVWCKIPDYIYGDFREPCRNGLIWIPTAITLIFYLLYLIECFHCKIHKDLVNIISSDNAEIILQRWIKAKPVVRWRALCYHYGRSFRQRYNQGSGGPHSVPQLQYTRINSHTTEGIYKPYDCGCMDKSTPLKHIQDYAIIKVDIEKTFSFGCSCSEAAYLTQRKAFYERHVTVDDFIELNEVFHLAGTQVPDSLCVIHSCTGMPWYFGKLAFWFFSLVCLSWPIRMAMERKTAYAAVAIHKEFGGRCNGVLATSGHSLSSYDSKVSDNVFGIIPSYSEALLMSSYTLNGTRIPSTTALSSRVVMARPGTYETIYSNDQHLTHTRPHRSKHSNILISQTTDNLLCIQPPSGHTAGSLVSAAGPTSSLHRAMTLPRSVSLQHSAVKRSECTQNIGVDQSSAQLSNSRCGGPQVKKYIYHGSSSRKSHSSSSLANSLKHMVTPSVSNRSKTVSEKMYLL